MHARPIDDSPTATKPRSLHSQGYCRHFPSCKYMLFLHCLQVQGYPGINNLQEPSTSRSVQWVVVVSVAEVVVAEAVVVVEVAVVAVRLVVVVVVVVDVPVAVVIEV